MSSAAATPFLLAVGLVVAGFALDRILPRIAAANAANAPKAALYEPKRDGPNQTDYSGAPEVIRGESWSQGVVSLGAETVFDPADPDGPEAARYRAPCFVQLSLADADGGPIVPPDCDRRIAFKPYITST